MYAIRPLRMLKYPIKLTGITLILRANSEPKITAFWLILAHIFGQNGLVLGGHNLLVQESGPKVILSTIKSG